MLSIARPKQHRPSFLSHPTARDGSRVQQSQTLLRSGTRRPWPEQGHSTAGLAPCKAHFEPGSLKAHSCDVILLFHVTLPFSVILLCPFSPEHGREIQRWHRNRESESPSSAIGWSWHKPPYEWTGTSVPLLHISHSSRGRYQIFLLFHFKISLLTRNHEAAQSSCPLGCCISVYDVYREKENRCKE